MDTEFIDDGEWDAIERALQSAQNNTSTTHINTNTHSQSNNSRNNNAINTGKIINNTAPQSAATSTTHPYTATQPYQPQAPPYIATSPYSARGNSTDPRPVARQSMSAPLSANTSHTTIYGNAPSNNGNASPRLLSTSQLLGRSVAQSPTSTPPVNSPKLGTAITLNGNVPGTVNIPHSPTQFSPAPYRPALPNSTSLNAPRPITINGNGPHSAINSPAPSPTRPISAQSSPAPLHVGSLPVGTYELSLVARDRFMVQHVIFKNFQRIPMAITHPNFVRLLSSLLTAKYGKYTQ